MRKTISVINIMMTLLLVLMYAVDVYLGNKVSAMSALIPWGLALVNSFSYLD